MQDNLWLVLQLSDSAFPTGGFVHSGGLEAAAQSGLVYDRESIYKYLVSQMTQTIQLYIPIVSVAYHCGRDMEKFAQIDQFCQAVISNNVANRASRTQDIIANNLFAHQSTVFGLVYNILGIDLATTQQLYLFATLRAFISTAVRLNIIGPIEAQNIQFKVGQISNKELSLFLERQVQQHCKDRHIVDQTTISTNQDSLLTSILPSYIPHININAANTSDHSKSIWNMEGKWNELEEHLEVFQISPLLDLVQGMQDRLYSRMFNS